MNETPYFIAYRVIWNWQNSLKITRMKFSEFMDWLLHSRTNLKTHYSSARSSGDFG